MKNPCERKIILKPQHRGGKGSEDSVFEKEDAYQFMQNLTWFWGLYFILAGNIYLFNRESWSTFNCLKKKEKTFTFSSTLCIFS